MNRTADILKSIRNHVDPFTGEFLDPDELSDPDSVGAIIDLFFMAGLNSNNAKKNFSKNELNRPVNQIFEILKSWRLDEARTINLPAYMIFSDNELFSIASGDAITEKDLLRIRGINSKKYELYSKAILNIVKQFD